MPISILKTFIVIFVVILLFLILNTTFGGYVFPVFDTIGTTVTNTSTMNASTYQAHSDTLQSAFWLVLYIFIIIPFLYLFVRIFKKEPEPQQYPGYGGEY